MVIKEIQRRPRPFRECCKEDWRWNQYDKSPEARLLGPKGRTVQFHPNWSNGTAGVRGTQPLNYGCHYWEIHLADRIFGTSMMIGVGTSRARLHVDAFVNLLGENCHSWGLSHKGTLWHNGTSRQYTKPFQENQSTTIGVLFDWYEGTLTYYKDGMCLGVAFTGLNRIQENMYPIVCSTAAKTEMTLGVTARRMDSLQDRCRAAIAKQINYKHDVDRLPLPNMIRCYVKELVTVDPTRLLIT